MKKALVAIDKSEVSKALLSYSFRFARNEGIERLDFLHVLESFYHEPAGAVPFYKNPDTGREEREENARKEFEKLITGIKGDEKIVDFSVIIRTGVPYEEIINQAEEGKYEMLLIGHRGMSNIKRFFIGSVAAKVARHSPCTTLIYQKPEK
jgi:nucleotide-binding universal stress UspA family protein